MFALALALLVSAPTAEARPLQWTLDCRWDLDGHAPIGSPRFQVQKTAFKGRDGKWDAKYAIVMRPIRPGAEPRILALEPAGSGDEDYNEYNVAGRDAPVQGAYIQNQFKWATIVDNEGTGAYRCE